MLIRWTRNELSNPNWCFCFGLTKRDFFHSEKIRVWVVVWRHRFLKLISILLSWLAAREERFLLKPQIFFDRCNTNEANFIEIKRIKFHKRNASQWEEYQIMQVGKKTVSVCCNVYRNDDDSSSGDFNLRIRQNKSLTVTSLYNYLQQTRQIKNHLFGSISTTHNVSEHAMTNKLLRRGQWHRKQIGSNNLQFTWRLERFAIEVEHNR